MIIYNHSALSSNNNSISTEIFQGNELTPTADLAGIPISSPKTSLKSCDAPLITRG
jgi:hypothetical protein